MRIVKAQPLTTEAFAPYGDVLVIPTVNGRYDADAALASTRPSARPSLGLSQRDPVSPPLRVTQMERHRFSSQTFLPLAPVRFLVLVAPHGADGPDMEQAQAFLAGPGQGITYGADVWHHPMAVLDTPARFATLIWRDGSADDEQFVDVQPFTLELG